MVGSFFVGCFGVEGDGSFVFVTVFEEIIGHIGSFDFVVEEKLAEGERGKAGGLVGAKGLFGIAFVAGGFFHLVVENVFVIVAGEGSELSFDLAFGVKEERSSDGAGDNDDKNNNH